MTSAKVTQDVWMLLSHTYRQARNNYAAYRRGTSARRLEYVLAYYNSRSWLF